MTTDTTALQERIARAIHLDDLQAGEAEQWGANEYLTAWYRRNAAAVLPIIAAEVQAAQIEAWQEGVNFALPNAETTWYPQHNPYRATEYETGDQA